MAIVINGQEYEERDLTKPKSNVSKKLNYLAAIAQTFAFTNPYADYGGGSYSRRLPNNINIVKEFELIQQKKSRLSKWEREQVVATFEYHYRPITPNQK